MRVAMNEQAVAIYFICDEVTKCFGKSDDPQSHMSTAEVMAFALIAALHYKGNYRFTRLVSISCRYFRKPLSLSRLIRRIHQIPQALWMTVVLVLQMYLRKTDSQHFIIDSFPVKAYENYKSFRARIFRGKNYHGYNASKKEYFFGIKVHMIIDEDGVPIEFCFTPASNSDLTGLKQLPCELPENTILFGDKAYTSYELEDDLKEMAKITLMPKRRVNLKRQHSGAAGYILNSVRNRIETAFSSIISRLPRHIHARTEAGFFLKLLFFIMAYMFNLSFKHM
jgi:hypothetical protein